MLWEELISLEMTSLNLVPTLKALLRSRDDLIAMYKLAGPEAQRVVDFINQAIDSPQLTESLRKKALHALCKLCDSCQLLPIECVLGDELVETKIQIGSGGFADVWGGTYGGMQVAVKRLRFRESDNFKKIYRRFCKEVVIWKRLSHPNILPLLGVSTIGEDLRMISKLMNYGNLMAYLRTRPSANRLLLLSNVGEGLTYLHGLDLIHGDLKGANILVDDECMPRIADFGLMSIMRDTDTVLDTHTSAGGIGTPRWSAPELLDPPSFGLRSCQPSKQSDCYSFGMTIYEVLTGKAPFHGVRTDAVFMRVIRGIRPERPPFPHAIGFTDPVWAIVERCWKDERSFRPDAPTVAECLVAAAARWTPTPPLDEPCATKDSQSFSLISLYSSSESSHASDPESITPRNGNLNRDEDLMEDKDVTPPHYQNTAAENLHALAERFYDYYQRSGKLCDLDWAIEHEKQAVLTCLPTHPGRLRCLIRLAGYYHERYEVSQDPQDIRSSIEKSSEVERRTTADDSIRPDALLPLAKAYYIYNYHDPQPENLQFTIKYGWEASNLYPIGHPSRAESLVVLSVALYGRYQASLDRGNFQPPQKDLDDAIASSVAAIGLFPLGDSRLPYTHSQLSTFLFARYQRQRGLDDLRQSVHHARLVSVYLAPEQRPESLIHLGYLLTHLSHDPKNLTELAKCSREALELLSPDDHRRPAAIHNLVTASHRMYVTLNSAGHLDEAIGYNRQLLHLLPYGSAPWYSQLQLHRNLLGYRWNERQVDADFVEMTESAGEVAAMESQSYHGPFHPPQTPFSASAILPGEPPTARSYYPLQHRSPGPYYYDDSAISIAGSDYASTGSEKMGIMAAEFEVNRALSAVLP